MNAIAALEGAGRDKAKMNFSSPLKRRECENDSSESEVMCNELAMNYRRQNFR
jgi:hypothetical protein